MLSVTELLKKVPFFQRLSQESLDDIATIGTVQQWPADKRVFAEGESPAGMYLILNGTVELRKITQSGQSVSIAKAGGGEFFGEMALVDASPRSATAQTLTPCDFFVIGRERFTELLSQCPHLIPSVLLSLVGKIRAINDQFLSEILEKQALQEQILQERYRSITSIAAAANEANNTDDAMRIVLEQLCGYIGWPVGHVHVSEPGDSQNFFSAGIWYLKDPARYEQFRRVSEMVQFSEGVGVVGRVLSKGKSIWMEDLTVESLGELTTAAASAGLQSAFAFPIVVEKRVNAILEFYSDERKPIDRLLLESTQQISSQLGRLIERRNLTEKLAHNAFHDALTDLPNRSLLNDRLEMSVQRAKRNPSHQFALFYLDLDRFKWINDSLGHEAGDRLLIEVARRLRTCVRPTDTVARLGGDEFVVLVDGFQQLSFVPRQIERIRTELKVPFELKEGDVATSASIGVTISTVNYDDAASALRDADTAMYRAKSQGPGNYAVFDANMHASAVKRLSLDNDLRRGLERGELELYYQPIVLTGTGAVEGFEALVRWNHPTLGLLSPMEFLPVAEDTELIMPLTEWVLEEACKQVREWKTCFPTGLRFSVSTNLAPKFFIRREVHDRIKDLLSRHSFDPYSLKLEITEGQMIEDPSSVTRMLARLADLGIRVHIDDFGTGYSSLRYLAELRVDGLKIDQIFVAGLAKDERNSAIVRSIIDLGENLGLEVIAEGVETEAQRSMLVEMGCAYAQGFYFSRPMPVAAATRYLQKSLFPGMNDAFPVSAINLGQSLDD